jgi:SPX domain protein involved in polyphosphate accumulation
MKFGETFVQRSVPEWAPFNLKYNQMKENIKQRTSDISSGPVAIPQQGRSRWADLDNTTFNWLKDQYENISLFLRMKQGEIDRRLQALSKDIERLRASASEKANSLDGGPQTQGRKFRRTTKEIEELSDLVQKTSRFATAQRIAYRKILKKYTKWTGSTALQTRVENDLLATSKFRTDYSDELQDLSEFKRILVEELSMSLSRSQKAEEKLRQQQARSQSSAKKSPISEISGSLSKAPAAFDTTLATVSYGISAGSAFYWVHPENVDEARALLHRHMRREGPPSNAPTRQNSNESLKSRRSVNTVVKDSQLTHLAFYDNAQRFVQDPNDVRPSKIALCACWGGSKDAAVGLLSLSPAQSSEDVLVLDHEDLVHALDRDKDMRNLSQEASRVQKWLVEHRDVKPLAQVSSHRTRYFGSSNSAEVATWATLDTSVQVSAVDVQHLGENRPSTKPTTEFPYAVLHIRWEFARTPEIVRAFDESHLAYRVQDFTLEDMAIRNIHHITPQADWQSRMEKDITKLPLALSPVSSNFNRLKTSNKIRLQMADVSGSSSGPSSNESRADSIFSTTTRGYQSATSEDIHVEAASRTPAAVKKPRKHPGAAEPRSEPIRYWNEFDDGDSDVNVREGYAIYVDPDEPVFPEMSKALNSIKSWLGIASRPHSGERARLLDEETASFTSSDSGSLMLANPQSMGWGTRALVGGITMGVIASILVLIFIILQVI